METRIVLGQLKFWFTPFLIGGLFVLTDQAVADICVSTGAGRPVLSGTPVIISSTNFRVHYTLSGSDVTTLAQVRQLWTKNVDSVSIAQKGIKSRHYILSFISSVLGGLRMSFCNKIAGG